MGFCQKWISWIEGCLKSSSISVLVNRSTIDQFIPQRGLRQGDPLAPFLFIIVAKGLARLMREAEKKGMYAGFLVVKDKMEVDFFNMQTTLCVSEMQQC